MPTLNAYALPHLVTAVPGPASRAWLTRLRACESPNVTALADEFPVVWHQAKGGAVQDADGNVFIDATSAFGVALIGHAHPDVVAAVRDQSELLLHAMGDVHPAMAKIVLLEALRRAAPGGLGHAVLCTGGSEAVEVALKTALLATGRPGVVAFAGAYHGLGHGALDVTSRRDFRAPFNAQLAHNTVWVPFAQTAAPPVGVSPDAMVAHVLQRIDDAIVHPSQGGTAIGAVLIEPILGRGGVVVPPVGFLQALRQLCDDRGVLLIADEIFTGCGRTGPLWACDTEGVVPDILCCGKALGGGMPIAACLGKPDVMASWGPSQGEALHTSTFLGHPVACAAATAALTIITDAPFVQLLNSASDWWRAELKAALDGHPAVAEIRGRGLMLGVALRDHAGVPAGERAWRTVVGALQRGLLVLPCGSRGEVIGLQPPAVLTPEQRQAAVAILAQALAATMN